jgi:hypothetical protein
MVSFVRIRPATESDPDLAGLGVGLVGEGHSDIERAVVVVVQAELVPTPALRKL